MNEFKFYGSALETPEMIESDRGNKYCYIKINVSREYKNQDGSVGNDDFKVACFKTLAEEATKNVKKGQNIIIKGRLQENNFQKENGEIIYRPELVGERIYYTN